MPLTQLANTAQDRIPMERPAIIETVAAYGATDLVCHRAEHPDRLVAAQAAAWQPWLDWLAEWHGIRLLPVTGLLAVQDPDMLARVPAVLAALEDTALTAVQATAAVTGSMVLGLALGTGALDGDQAYQAAFLEDEYGLAEWGEDAEARARLDRLKAELRAIARFAALGSGLN